jgi:hypothetical protein
MSGISLNVKANGPILWRGYNALASMFLTVRRSIDERITRHREERILRALHPRLLADAGYEPILKIDIVPDHTGRGGFPPLCETFSWTRFGK